MGRENQADSELADGGGTGRRGGDGWDAGDVGGGWDVWRGDDGRAAGSGECGRAAWRGSGGRATGHADGHGGAGVGVCSDGCIWQGGCRGGGRDVPLPVSGNWGRGCEACGGDRGLAGVRAGRRGDFRRAVPGRDVVVWASGEAGDFVETVFVSGGVCEGLSDYGEDCCVL